MSKKKVTSENNPPEKVLQQALSHLDASEELFKKGHAFLDSAGYLAQLGIELMLKSWCLYLHGVASDDHKLDVLVNSINRHSPELSINEDFTASLKEVSNFYNLRYADKSTVTEVGTEDLEKVNYIAEYIWDRMPEEIINAYQAIPFHVRGHRVLMRKPK